MSLIEQHRTLLEVFQKRSILTGLSKVSKTWRRGKSEVRWRNRNGEEKELLHDPDEFIYSLGLADYILIDINWR